MGGGLFGGAVGISLLFFYIIMAVVGLFLGAVILLVISAICKGSTDFEANVRVTASVMVIMPIKALLGFITGLNLTAGIIVGLIISLFSLYLLYHGLVETLKSKKETTRILIYILVAIFVLFMLIGFGARNRTRKLMNEFNNTGFKELLKEEYSD